jgi:hypothetical protein
VPSVCLLIRNIFQTDTLLISSHCIVREQQPNVKVYDQSMVCGRRSSKWWWSFHNIANTNQDVKVFWPGWKVASLLHEVFHRKRAKSILAARRACFP